MLTITASNASIVEEGLWKIDMPPHQVRLFGSASHSIGSRSVILIKNCEFDSEFGTLKFDADDVTSLNIGTLSQTIVVAESTEQDNDTIAQEPEESTSELAYGPGDREFLNMTRAMFPKNMQDAAAALLAGVRRRSAGELKRGKARNFSDTPDNFWYVIVQPRISQLSITVRGPEKHFEEMAKLPTKDDRGNTLFKVTGEADVAPALDLIFHAKRKL
jgi:hypothetical protein